MANYDLTYEGSRVQGILDTGDELRDAGYIFRGEATPSTVPGTPIERVAYIGGPGTYTNFGSSITVDAGCICVFKYTGSAWSNQVINTGLSDAISSEATTRSEADTALQNAITAIKNNIDNGYVYAGVATLSTEPVSGKVFYLAVQAGTYTNFGNAVVTAGLNVLKYNGSAWNVDQVIAIDAEPTQGSDNLVKSGGVLGSIIQNGPAFDLSAYNAQEGVLATYADLSAALTALNALPADFKKGGMSFKFVLTSDNNYYRFDLIADEFTTDVTYWQGVSSDKEVFDNPDDAKKNQVPSVGAVSEVYGKYVDSNEFIRVFTVNGGVIFAIKKDLSIEWAFGVPTPVKEFVEAYVADKIAEIMNGSESTDIDGLTKVYNFLDGLSTSSTLKELLDDINDRVPSVIDYPEFVKVFTINGGIVWGLEPNGNIRYGLIPEQITKAIYSDIEQYIRSDSDYNVIISKVNSSKFQEGQAKNTTIGYENITRLSNPSGGDDVDNVAIGFHAMFGATAAKWNVAVGSEAMDRPTGQRNVGVGYYATAGYNYHDRDFTPTIEDCTGVGAEAMKYVRGNRNTALGAFSLQGLHTGNNNLAIGYCAGKYVDVEQVVNQEHPYDADYQYDNIQNTFYLDNLDRGNKANMEALSLLVGKFADSIANQELKVNGKFAINGATPQAAVTAESDATDLESAITLLNQVKDVLVNFGLLKNN